MAEPIGSGWLGPVALEFLDGLRLLVAQKGGEVWYVEDKVKHNLVLSLADEVLNNGDRGLLGLAADPAFDENGRIYLLLVVDPDGDGDDSEQESFTRLVRYATHYDAGGNLLADPGSRTVLLGASWSSGIPSLHYSHSAGQLAFLSDGSLLAAHGDGAHYDLIDAGGHDPLGFEPGRFPASEDIGAFRSLELGSLAGKILRLDPETGLGLADNPFYTGNPDDAASRVWALGLRNPYRFTLVPGSGPREALFVCDVGSVGWEELDLCLGGENFGWPCYEGAPEQEAFQGSDPHDYCAAVAGVVQEPWLAWNRTSPGSAGFTGNCTSGACVYAGTSYPPICRGALFFCDYGQGWMKVARLEAGLEHGPILSFGTNLGFPVDIVREPTSGDLVYLSLDPTGNQVLRLRYAPSNLPPVAVAQAMPTWGPAPLLVQFSAAGSYDPEGDTLDYHWDLGDGTSSDEPEVSRIYPTSATYTVVLTVTDDLGQQDSAEIVINSDDTPPVILSLAEPADGQLYEEGVPIQLSCSVADAEDDAAGTPLQVEWTFDLIHDHHQHPEWASLAGTEASWTPEPHGGGSHWLQLTLAVTDSRGLSDERSLRLYEADAEPLPHLVWFSWSELRLGVPLAVRAHVDYATPPGAPLADLTIEWGDGASDLFPGVAHQEELEAEHEYTALGSYTLRLVASAGEHSNETTTPIEVERPSRAVAVFVPLIAERNVGWPEQLAIAQELLDALAPCELTVFSWDEQEELEDWLQAYLIDDLRDVLVLVDLAPSLVFAGEAEDSLAERWIEAGNGIVWTGALPFAESIASDGSTLVWGPSAVDGLLDALPGVCRGAGPELLQPIARYQLPSLTATSATNALLLDRLGPAWRALRVFARGAGQDSDAVELRHAGGGMYAQFYCIPGEGQPRAAVLAEFLRLGPRGRLLRAR